MKNAAIFADLVSRLLLIVEELRHAVGSYPYKGKAAYDIVVLVRASLRRRFQRFERALARFQAGEPPHPSGGAAPHDRTTGGNRTPAGGRSPESPGLSRPRLSRKKGWLVLMMPYVVAMHGYRLALWLDDPAVVALLRACPEARRILRPIWWMVSSDPLPAALREPSPAEPCAAGPEDAASALARVVAAVAVLALTRDAAPAPAQEPVQVMYQLWDPQRAAPTRGDAAAQPAPPRREMDG